MEVSSVKLDCLHSRWTAPLQLDFFPQQDSQSEFKMNRISAEADLLGPLPHLSPFTLQPGDDKEIHSDFLPSKPNIQSFNNENAMRRVHTCACASSSTERKAKKKKYEKTISKTKAQWEYTEHHKIGL